MLKTLTQYTLFVFVAFVLIACSSRNKAEKQDTRLEKSQEINGQTVGIKDGNVVVQKKVMLAESLRKLEREVFALENDVYGNERYGSKGQYGVLKECHAKLSDPRIGGTGTLKPLPPMDLVTSEEEELKFVIDEKDQLVGVSEEMLRDRINRFQGYRKILSDRKTEIQTDIEICDQQHKTALINMGLNPEDGQARGTWVTGPQGYKVWRKKAAETSDPEKLSKRKAQREGMSQEDAPSDSN